MKLGVVKRILKEDFSGGGEKPPSWFDKFLAPLNEFIEKTATALQNRLTFEDNFSCRVVTQDFTHNVELEINPSFGVQGNLRVTGVLPLSSGNLSIDKFGWSLKNTGNIGVKIQFDGGSSSTVQACKVLILLG